MATLVKPKTDLSPKVSTEAIKAWQQSATILYQAAQALTAYQSIMMKMVDDLENKKSQ